MLVLMSNLVSSSYCYELLICWLATRDKKYMTIIKPLRITLKYRPSFYSVSVHGGSAFSRGGSVAQRLRGLARRLCVLTDG